jgi:gamma-glutamyltranspeptidase/glutathione hydrolase
LTPVVVQRDGRFEAVAGTMGGFAQPQINAMSVIRVFDLDRSPAEAVAQPRWLVGGMSAEGEMPWVVAEADVPAVAIDALQRRGYRVDTLGERKGSFGHAQLIRAHSDGFDAGSDPRADGGALAS